VHTGYTRHGARHITESENAKKTGKSARSVDFQALHPYKPGHVREGWSRLTTAERILFEINTRYPRRAALRGN
jgi:hypothetical protein